MAGEVDRDSGVDVEDEAITLVHDDIATRLAAYRRGIGADGEATRSGVVVIPEAEDAE
jgi:hypothetical protein